MKCNPWSQLEIICPMYQPLLQIMISLQGNALGSRFQSNDASGRAASENCILKYLGRYQFCLSLHDFYFQRLWGIERELGSKAVLRKIKKLSLLHQSLFNVGSLVKQEMSASWMSSITLRVSVCISTTKQLLGWFFFDLGTFLPQILLQICSYVAVFILHFMLLSNLQFVFILT